MLYKKIVSQNTEKTAAELTKENGLLIKKNDRLITLIKRLRIYKDFFYKSSIGFATTDLKGNITKANEAFAAMHGFTVEKLIGKNLKSLHNEDLINSLLTRLSSFGKFYDEKIASLKNNGESFTAIMNGWVIHSNNFLPTGFAITVKDISYREAIEQELVSKEKFYRSIIESIDEIILMMDQDGIFIDVDQKKNTDTLYLPYERFVGRHYSQVMPNDISEKISKTINDLYTTNQKSISFDYCLEINDKEEWFNANLSKLNDNGGSGKIIAVIKNISERKTDEHKIKLLLKEILHRTKNNFSIVSAMLNLQAMTTKSEETVKVLKAAISQLNTMSSLHEILYTSSADHSHVHMEEYFEKISRQLPDISFEIDARNIFLPSSIAVSCGLIVNELITNCKKYAFNGNIAEPTIKISLTNLDGTSYVLTVQDNGSGMSEDFNIEQAQSFGLQMINALIQQLKGTLNIESTEGTGTKTVIAFKNN
jgi:PAS domain S-box-containing protein